MSIAHRPQFQAEPFRSFGQAVEAALTRLYRSGLNVDFDDARQEAWAAVLECSRRYNPDQGRAYSYAHTAAKRAVFNYATRSSTLLKLSKHLVESGGSAVRERYGKAVYLDAKPDPDRVRLPVSDLGPEEAALEAEAQKLRARLVRQGQRLALQRCARGMGVRQRRAVKAVLLGATLDEAAVRSRLTAQAVSSALRAFIERVRADVYCAGLPVQMAQLEKP